MVISFSHDIPWEELVNDGEVVTFRKERRKAPNGKTWCNRGRGESKEFDVDIEEIGRADPHNGDLETFVSKSGFDSTQQWREAIQALNGDLPDSGWLYRVTPRNGDS